jgi:hypothetical protein
MSRRVRTEETSLWITFESLTFFPLLVCRGVWERRKPHYGSHSSLSLSSLYWYVAACENGGNFTTDHIRVSHFLPFTGMSRRVRTGETSLRITFESLTFFPLLVCRGVWELRKLHYGSHSSLSLSSLYWYVAACENWGNFTTDHIRVTLCHKYIMIAHSMQNSLLTFAYFRNLHFHWMVDGVTRMWRVIEFLQISHDATYQYKEQVRVII